jgi:mannose-6-phosphate isomerase-like protein (cupin superfamily)
MRVRWAVTFAVAGVAVATVRAGDPVVHVPASEAGAAFAKGATLTRGPGYRIDASNRTAPGEVEVHEEETDIFYVIDGAATLVTGGTMKEGREVGPGEIRGKDVAGGEVRRIGKGDVVVIPKGTPHWFREVQRPTTYFVVKVR